MPHCRMVKKKKKIKHWVTIEACSLISIHFDEVRMGSLTTFQENNVEMKS